MKLTLQFIGPNIVWIQKTLKWSQSLRTNISWISNDDMESNTFHSNSDL